MKKEIIISDINFSDPLNDQKYVKNVIRNLAGNYYFSTEVNTPKNQDMVYTPENWDTPSTKPSLAYDENDIVISSVQSTQGDLKSPEEYVTFYFEMKKWQNASQDLLTSFANSINKKLGDEYYYGISKKINNTIQSNDSDEAKLIYKYGEYYYDFSIITQTPFVFPNNDKTLEEKVLANASSGTYASTAKIEPLYNFYDKAYEDVSLDNAEQILFNYYVLHYYIKNDKVPLSFFKDSFYPMFQKYKEYLKDIIPEKLYYKIIDDALQYGIENSNAMPKDKIIFSPDTVDFLNDINYTKYEQPFGLEITFPPQEKKVINSLIHNLSSMFFLEKYVYKQSKKMLTDDLFAGEALFLNDGTIKFKTLNNIEYVSLNDWVKNISLSDDWKNETPIDPAKTITFTITKNLNESNFLLKIKKFLLQKKIDALINQERRSFTDILAGAPAYNEVLFYEIKKYNKSNQLIQSILVPNTKEVDFYRYFDTQIKYGEYYSYEVIAWTFIIGNKYKYFDRVKMPPETMPITKYKYNLIGNAKGESGYFKWLRILDVFSYMYQDPKYSNAQQIDFNAFVKENPEIFGTNTAITVSDPNIQGPEPKKEYFMDLSNTLSVTYANISIKYKEGNKSEANVNFNDTYQKLLDIESTEKSKQNVLQYFNKALKNFCDLFAKFIVFSHQNNYSEFISTNNGDNPNKYVGYETSGKDTSISQPAKNITDKYSYWKISTPHVSNHFYSSKKVIEFILEAFKQAGVIYFKTFSISDLYNILESYTTNASKGTPFPQYTISVSEVVSEISNSLNNVINIDYNLIFDGAYKKSSYSAQKDVDLSVTPNIGLDAGIDPYFPRFNALKTKKGALAYLQFGVYNETEVILAGIPYVSKEDVSQLRVVSSPPTAPDVLVIPYKNISNKIKFFLSPTYDVYRMKPISIVGMDEPDTIDKAKALSDLLTYEKEKGFYDGKITYGSGDPAKEFWVYKTENKPATYNDFFNKKVASIKADAGGFEDNIEPNKKYYYIFVSVDYHGLFSNPTAVYEVEIYENSGAIYPIIKVIDLEEEDTRSKILSFREQFAIGVNKKHILENENNLDTKKQIKSASDIQILSKFGSLNPSIFEKKFKIRITSKATKKKLDINLTFTKDKDITSFIKQKQKKIKA